MKDFNFGVEMAKIHPIILRAVMKYQENIFKQGNLAVTHLVVLEFLDEKGAGTMGELAKVLNLTMSAVTVIVDKMISMKLVERRRSEEDRRIVRVELIDKGKKILQDTRKSKIKMLNDMYSVLTVKERKEFLGLMTKVCDDLRKKL